MSNDAKQLVEKIEINFNSIIMLVNVYRFFKQVKSQVSFQIVFFNHHFGLLIIGLIPLIPQTMVVMVHLAKYLIRFNQIIFDNDDDYDE